MLVVEPSISSSYLFVSISFVFDIYLSIYLTSLTFLQINELPESSSTSLIRLLRYCKIIDSSIKGSLLSLLLVLFLIPLDWEAPECLTDESSYKPEVASSSDSNFRYLRFDKIYANLLADGLCFFEYFYTLSGESKSLKSSMTLLSDWEFKFFYFLGFLFKLKIETFSMGSFYFSGASTG